MLQVNYCIIYSTVQWTGDFKWTIVRDFRKSAKELSYSQQNNRVIEASPAFICSRNIV